jgi:predicted transcriptional regulator
MRMTTLGPLQLRIMNEVWKVGPSTVHDIHESLNRQSEIRPLAYTTVLTVMRNLAKRRFLHQDSRERVHRFTATIDENSYKTAMVHNMRLDFFDGKVEPFIITIARDTTLDGGTRDHLNRMAKQLGEG